MKPKIKLIVVPRKISLNHNKILKNQQKKKSKMKINLQKNKMKTKLIKKKIVNF